MRVKLVLWGPYIGLNQISLSTAIPAVWLMPPSPCCGQGGVVSITSEDLIAAGGDATTLGIRVKYPFAMGSQVTLVEE